MYFYSPISEQRLSTADPDLQRVFRKVLQIVDHAVLEGYRDENKQNQYYKENKSRVQYPKGKHNGKPSKAVDVAPWVNGKASYQIPHCIYFAGVVMAVAELEGVRLRWGGNWDMDAEVMTDQDFQDLVHFEKVD